MAFYLEGQEAGLDRLLEVSDAAGAFINEDPQGIFIGVPSSPVHFSASLDTETNLMHFDIRTVDDDGERHPLFEKVRAHHLAAAAIADFDEQSTDGIEGIHFAWKSPSPQDPTERSDNYHAYMRARNHYINQGLSWQEAKRRAVFATWTVQRIALPNGFTHLDRHEEIALGPSYVVGAMLRKRPSV